jgi:putative Mn2+ efflux pump MntP
VTPFATSFGRYVAFIVLVTVAGRMIYEATRDGAPATSRPDAGFAALLGTAIGTSIDGIAIGAGLAIAGETIWLISVTAGVMTFVMAAVGIALGGTIGHRLGRSAGLVGGLVIIAIATMLVL